MATSTRIITAHDKAVAKRLKSIYLQKKDELGLTQIKMGKAMKLSQSSVANYMGGTFSMNLEIILRFAKVLQVDPHDIDPKLDRRFTVIPLAGATKIMVLGTLSGQYTTQRSVEVRGLQNMAHHLAILIDTDDFSPILKQGTVLVVDPQADYEKDDRIIVQRLDGGQPGQYIPYRMGSLTAKTLTVKSFESVDRDRGDIMEARYFPHKPLKIPIKEISTIFKIVNVQYP
jgi:hypothetical protein